MTNGRFDNGSYFSESIIGSQRAKFRIAGTLKERSGRFGNVQVIEGNLSDFEAVMARNNVVPAKPFALKIDVKKKAESKTAAVQNNLKKAIAKSKQSVKASAANYTLRSFDEVIANYNDGLSEEQIKVWTYYQKGRLFDLKTISAPSNGWSKYLISDFEFEQNKLNWIEQGILAFDGKEYLPEPVFYAGNIYNKIESLTSRKSIIVDEIGEAAYTSQLSKLNELLPEKLLLDAPVNERLFISPRDPFINDFKVQGLSDGTKYFDPMDLQSAFVFWLRELPREEFPMGSSAHDITDHFLTSTQFARGTSEKEKSDRKRKAQGDGTVLFGRFLAEMVLREDRRKIEHVWNKTYNSFVDYDYSKVPFGLEMNKHFKNFELEVRPAQREGVAFGSINGTGIIAYDVGVGKTMTAIIALGQALYTGQCKRPLIVVPNPVYDKFKAEITGLMDKDGKILKHGILPQYPINDYYNLGKGYGNKPIDEPVLDGTITMITYEGLKSLGFSETAEGALENELFDILSQGGVSARDQEKLREKVQELIGTGTAETMFNVDELGFDYLVVDEAHNMKKVFTRVNGSVDEEGNRDQRRYSIDSGEPSAQALKTFFISHVIKQKMGMKNIMLLTATPFTNSPLEVYSMLAMVGYEQLKERGINNISAFFDKFVNETSEWVINSRGSFQQRNVIKSWTNKIVLQSIVFQYINYKSGEEANIVRPEKVVYPLLKGKDGKFLSSEDQIESSLPPTPTQEYWLKQISIFANNAQGSMDNDIDDYLGQGDELEGRELRAINYSKQTTLTPYLFPIAAQTLEPITPERLIESSPKLKYTVECLKTIKQHHESKKESVSGIVIFMNQGTDLFPLLKEYIVSNVGYSAKEVEIISGKTSAKKKEKVKNDFLSGQCKIIIGSSTIKEGIDLQDNATTLFNCDLPWNPTDVKQLEGRIWRFGNKHSHVRIVNPLVENSMDVFMFQKLEEKTSRINDIWYRAGRGNVLDVDELDPSELKLGLITDPEQRARQEINMSVEEQERELDIYRNYHKELSEAKDVIAQWQERRSRIKEYFAQSMAKLRSELSRAIIELNGSTTDKIREKNQAIVDRFEEAIKSGDDPEVSEKQVYRLIRLAERSKWYSTPKQTVDDQIEADKKIARLEKNILSKNDLSLESDFGPLIQSYQVKVDDISEKLVEMKSDAYFDELSTKFRKEREDRNKQSRSVEKRVQEFTKQNYLLSSLMKTSAPKVKEKTEPKAKQDSELENLEKAISEMRNKIAAQGMVTNARDEDHLANLIELYQKEKSKAPEDKTAKIKRAKAKAAAQKARIRILKLKEAA